MKEAIKLLDRKINRLEQQLLSLQSRNNNGHNNGIKSAPSTSLVTKSKSESDVQSNSSKSKLLLERSKLLLCDEVKDKIKKKFTIDALKEIAQNNKPPSRVVRKTYDSGYVIEEHDDSNVEIV